MDHSSHGDRHLSFSDATPESAGGPAAFDPQAASIVSSLQRDGCRAGDVDEDGACSGSLDAATWAIAGVLPNRR